MSKVSSCIYMCWVYWATPALLLFVLWATWLDAMESKTVWLAPQDAFSSARSPIVFGGLCRASFAIVFIFTTVFVRHTFHFNGGAMGAHFFRRRRFGRRRFLPFATWYYKCAAFYVRNFFFGNFYTFASTMIYLAFPSCNAMEMFSPHEWNGMEWEGRGRGMRTRQK